MLCAAAAASPTIVDTSNAPHLEFELKLGHGLTLHVKCSLIDDKLPRQLLLKSSKDADATP
eukprot:SAG11_NODE_19232_length_471_cov_1.107527_1_plen_60_part_10